MNLSGCGTALVTPFRGDGGLDEQSLTSLVEWQIQSGIDFLVACGTTAETPTLNDEEWLHVVRLVVHAAAGRVPVLAGCTHNATREAVERARRVAAIEGVDGILTANPYYNKPTQEGQYRHFRSIAEAVACPVVLYNIPSRAGVNLEPATVLRLVRDVPNIVGIKESSGNLQQITDLIHMAPDNFAVLAGDDGMALPVIALGGAGLVSVASNEIPAEMARMIGSALSGDWKTARALYRRYSGLIAANFWESSPGPVKCVMAMMGRLQENFRLPMVPVTNTTRARLAPLVEDLGLVAHPAQAKAM
ncbi:MAG TPA: 4-hydroxy-tetrahydrodipicolinate synthase [Acidobacteriaceae bacterium]|nr:4-hydroxy-tetrahydrodipicolinate synthase [Acidobacteriaceae bacterium]